MQQTEFKKYSIFHLFKHFYWTHIFLEWTNMFEDFLTSKNDLVVCRDNFADIVKNLNVQLIKWQETITDNKKASKEQYKSNF